MKEKLKNYCEYELSMCKRYSIDPSVAIDRCYGAVMFVSSQFEADSEEIGKWWNEEMHPRFYSEFKIY